MARIKLGTVVTEASGKLAGHCFQHSHGGMQLRTKPIPSGKPSTSQTLIRSLNPILQKGWRDLTDAQRRVWNLWAISHDIVSERSPHYPLSGHSLWMKYNFSWLQAGGTFLPDPSYWPSPILGPELIKNGNFDSSAFWTCQSPWSISFGKAHYNSSASSAIYQTVQIPSGISLIIKFDISNSVGNSRISFYSSPLGWFLSPPYNAPFLVSNGFYQISVTTTKTCQILKIYGYIANPSFSIDNISIKQVF